MTSTPTTTDAERVPGDLALRSSFRTLGSRWRAAGRAVAGLAVLMAVSGCSVSIGADGGAESSVSTSPSTAPSTASPATAQPGSRTILDGWVTYELAPGWEVVIEADGLEERRADFGRPPLVPAIEDLQTLVEIRRTDGRAQIALLREPAYLDAVDIDAWTADLVDEVAADGPSELAAEDVVQAPHGPIRRLRFEGAEGTLLLGTTGFDGQRLVVLASADPTLDDGEHQELRELAAAITLDPDIVLNPMLQHHGARYVFSEGGEPSVDVTLDVPSDWTSSDEPDGVRYQAPDARTTVEVYVSLADGRTADEVLRDARSFRPDREPIIDTTERRLGALDVTVVRHGIVGATADLDRATSWVIVGEADGVIVEIYLDDTRPGTDTMLLHRIVDTIEVDLP